jgi:hypothetical protein
MQFIYHKDDGQSLTRPPPVSIQVYAYKFGHTVSPGVAAITRIELMNEKSGYFHLEERGGHPLTQYNMTIEDQRLERRSCFTGRPASNPDRHIILITFIINDNLYQLEQIQRISVYESAAKYG